MALVEALNFVITADSTKAQADLKKLADATKDLERLEAAAKKLEPASKASAEGLSKFTAASAAVAQAKTQVQSLSGAVTQGLSPIDKLTGAFTAGLGFGAGTQAIRQGVALVKELGAALIDASQLAEQDVRSQFTLTQAIVNNTQAGYAGRDAAEEYVKSLQKQASIADDELRPALATLVRSTNDVAEAQNLLGLSADVAAGTGKDVGTVADALAKAYQSNTKALKALAPEVSKLIRDGADATEIFAKLTSVYAGSAAGLSDVSPWQRLNVQVEEIKEGIGVGLLPVVSQFADVAVKAADNVGVFDRAIQDTIKDGKTLAGILPQVFDALVPGSGEAGKKASDGFGFGDIAKTVAAGVPILGPAFVYLTEKMKQAREEAEKDKVIGDRWRQLAADISTNKVAVSSLLPLVEFLSPALRNVADAASGVKPPVDAAGASVEDFATKVKDAETALSGINSQLFGVADQQTALLKAVEDTSTSGTSSAKSYAAALRRIDDSTRSLVDAQKALQETEIQRFIIGLGASSDEVASAQIAERESTRSLADAKLKLIDAEQALARLKGGGAQASRLEAQAAVLDAEKALAQAQGSGDPSALLKARAALLKANQGLDDTSSAKQAQNIAKAQSDVEAATDGVTKAAIDQRSAQKDLNDTLIRGKDGSKELADANKQVEDAERRVEDATRNLDDAQDGLQDALTSTAGATKTASDRFAAGRAQAQAYLDYLVKNKGTPEEFAAAVGQIATQLDGVAEQAGKKKELQDYLDLIRTTTAEYLAIGSTALPPVPGSSGSGANAAEERERRTLQAIQLVVDGKVLAQVIVDESNKSPLPIRTRPTD